MADKIEGNLQYYHVTGNVPSTSTLAAHANQDRTNSNHAKGKGQPLFITSSLKENVDSTYIKKSRGSSVSIGTRLRDGRSEFDSRQGQGLFFSSPSRPDRLWGPPMVLMALSLGVKRPGREVDHSPPCNAEVKNSWSYTPIPPYVFVAWCLIKHRDNFTFTFTLCISRTV
jgi:hypothetical protein